MEHSTILHFLILASAIYLGSAVVLKWGYALVNDTKPDLTLQSLLASLAISALIIFF